MKQLLGVGMLPSMAIGAVMIGFGLIVAAINNGPDLGTSRQQ